MKKICILISAAIILQSCSLTSQTTIGPYKAFELGDGKHGAFTAVVKNISNVAVEVYATKLDSSIVRVAVLAPGKQKTLRFDADTKATFKNDNNEAVKVNLKVTGDTGLSMGGPNY